VFVQLFNLGYKFTTILCFFFSLFDFNTYNIKYGAVALQPVKAAFKINFEKLNIKLLKLFL